MSSLFALGVALVIAALADAEAAPRDAEPRDTLERRAAVEGVTLLPRED